MRVIQWHASRVFTLLPVDNDKCRTNTEGKTDGKMGIHKQQSQILTINSAAPTITLNELKARLMGKWEFTSNSPKS
jgi:hypothetical protein